VRACGKSALLKGHDATIVTVDRVRLAQQKLEELRDLGVEVRLGETARPMGYEAVIACDGASSRTRRGLGLPSASGIAALQRRYTQAQAMAAGLPFDRAIVWFEPKAWGCGYAWSFPAPGEVRLGCGVPMSHRRGLRRRFEEFVASLGLSAQGSRLEAGLVGTRYCGHRFGRIRLAGDAAGLASPLTGEGIYQALVSGAEVAREILEPGYLSPVIPELSTLHRRTVRALDQGGAASILYPMAPALLSLGLIARLTASRYVR
jgi:geranylgeranyl reductase